ncbi:Hint domain-containing protein [Gluconacetobacter azotocaptans]|uniref:Hint domain-containing protein n=1 Tax=Gluconacetobacter azotocaptans TaxID=142834 RepID=UPI001F033344|nr:Hint domain-containing protein [Gluconacetobacter azotocaptans]
MMALVSINAGTATVYSSGDLSGVIGLSAVSAIVVTKTADTPAGDPVVVNLTNLTGINALSSVTVENGATAQVGGGLIGVGAATNLTVDGGILEIEGSAIGAGALNTITVGPAGGEIKVDPTGLSLGVLNIPVDFVDASGNPTTTIPPNFEMDFPPTVNLLGQTVTLTSIAASYDVASNTTTIGDGVSLLGILGVGRTITLQGDPFDLAGTGTAHKDLFGNITSYSKSFTKSDGANGIITCFLPGTLVSTPDGTCAVEHMRVGDAVLAHVDGRDVVRTIVWVGTQSVTAHDRDDYPVRIRKDAFADGAPFMDLLVTPEHCLYVDGRLVPARMLVNGRSITAETSMGSFDVYHIETEEHSIVTTNGMLTESYLDTGNRRSFRPVQDGSVVVGLFGPRKTWEHDAAAPLCVARETVEPLFRRIEDRAVALGLSSVTGVPETTQEAGLHLVTETGRIIRQTREANGHAVFMIPPEVGHVHLVSRTSRPSDVVGPFLDDRRELGVLVGEVMLFDADITRRIDAHLTTGDLAGWDVRESAPCRWTNGNALLPLGARRPSTIGLLAVNILAAGPYLVRDGEGLPTPADRRADRR